MAHSSPHPHHLMLVDDSPSEIQALLGVLKNTYSTSVALSGEQALQQLRQNSAKLPDIILLDINMPGIDGYQTCKKIKDDGAFKNIDVIFFSANDSIEEITKGFDVGACDYITKPFEANIVLSKVKAAIKSQQTRKNLSTAATAANSIAMSAMRDSGDLGLIVSFLRSCFSIEKLEELAKKICETLESFGLNSCIYLYDHNENVLHSTQVIMNELETTLLQRLRGAPNTLHEHNQRLIITREGIALLIKNLPHDADISSRLKDHLMTLIEGISYKIDQLSRYNKAKINRQNEINQAIVNAHEKLQDIQQAQQSHKTKNVTILDTMVHDVEASFMAMGLTDTQEERLLTIMTHAVGNALDHFEKGMVIDEQLKEIINNLSSTIQQYAS